MRRAGEVAEHHAEAVIEGHWNADAVALAVFERLADEEAVVEDVVMGQRRALRKASGAGCVLDVDRVVELQRRLNLVQPRLAHHRGVPLQCVPSLFDHERLAEGGAPAFDLGQHAFVIGLAEGGREDQEADLGLV